MGPQFPAGIEEPSGLQTCTLAGGGKIYNNSRMQNNSKAKDSDNPIPEPQAQLEMCQYKYQYNALPPFF
jgi:hypothetical protein